MSYTNEYVAKVKEYMQATDELLAKKDEEIERLEDVVDKSYTYIAALKEMLCRSIEGKLDEETQKRILKKFRN